MKALIICNTLVAGLLLALGLFGILVLPKYVQDGVASMHKLTNPESPLYAAWLNPANNTDLFLEVYVYNVTNPKEVKEKGEKPILESIGPYMYEESFFKDPNTVMWTVNGTVRYKYHRTYRFRPDLSGGRLETDRFVTLNYPVCALLNLVDTFDDAGKAGFWKSVLPQFEKMETTMFITTNVTSILWNLTDPFIQQVAPTITNLSLLRNDDPMLYSDFSEEYAGIVSHHDNLTPDESLGLYKKWVGQESLSYWDSPYANLINGTSGWIFPRNVKETDVLMVYADQLFRSVNFTYSDAQSFDGIPMKCFTIEPSQLLDQKQNPQNAAFHMTETGFLPIPLLGGAFTKPYFLDAVMDNVHIIVDGEAPQPSSNRDDTYLCVEPLSGLTLSANRRIQVNFLMKELYSVKETDQHKYVQEVLEISKGLPTTWLPIIRLNDSVRIKQAAADLLRSKIYSPLFIGSFGGISCCVLSGVFVIITLLLLVSQVRQSRRKSRQSEFERDPLINNQKL